MRLTIFARVVMCRLIEKSSGVSIPGVIAAPVSESASLANIRKAFFFLEKTAGFDQKQLLADETLVLRAPLNFVLPFLAAIKSAFRNNHRSNSLAKSLQHQRTFMK